MKQTALHYYTMMSLPLTVPFCDFTQEILNRSALSKKN